MTAILLLSGVRGRDDEAHDLRATSAAIEQTLTVAGWDIVVRDVAEATAADLSGADALVVNCGLRSPPGADQAATAALTELLTSSRPVLAVHTSASTFPELSPWADRVGVRWVPGHSMHPPISEFAATPSESHPIGAGLGAVEVFDERYSHLEISGVGDAVLSHHLDGLDHPLSLARQDIHGGRTVYDALGHGVESYESPSRQELLRAEMRWLLGD